MPNIFSFFTGKKKEVDPFEVKSVEHCINEFTDKLLPLSYPERDEILQSVIKRSLPRKHLKYRPGQEKY